MLTEEQELKDFYYIVDKYKLAYHYNLLSEAMHVADDLDELAISIGDIIKNIILNTDFSDKESLNQLMSEAYYTGYNFNTNYLSDLLTNVIKPEPVLELNDESEKFPIYYQLSYNSSSQKANAIWRDKELKTFDRVFIDVNLAQFKNVDNVKVYYLLVSTIAHELQHMFDMYVVPEFNRLDKSIKNGMTVSYKNDNDFNVLSGSYDDIIISALLTLCSPEEKNARLAELKMIMTLLERNQELTDELFYETIRNNKLLIKTLEHENPVTMDELYDSVSTNTLIQSVTRCNIFSEIIKQMIVEKHMNRKHYNALMLIIGFYMYKHKLMDFQKDEIGKQDMKRILSDAELIKKIVDVKTMTAKQSPVYNIVSDIVFNTLKKNLDDYLRLVDTRLKDQLPVLYKFRKMNEVFGEYYGNGNEVILERISIS